MTSQKCKHDSCSCTTMEADGYCSTTCKDAKGVTDLACQCGHSGCKGNQLRV